MCEPTKTQAGLLFLNDQRQGRNIRLCGPGADPDKAKRIKEIEEVKRKEREMIYEKRKRKSDEDIESLFKKGASHRVSIIVSCVFSL